ncbi:hypothetical protein Leryth_017150, partial [Lithospermum erythrorhizon]
RRRQEFQIQYLFIIKIIIITYQMKRMTIDQLIQNILSRKSK